MSIKIAGFMHVAQMGNWKEVVDEQIALVQKSGLASKCDGIFVGVVGTQAIRVPKPFQVVYQDPNLKLYEYETLKRLWLHCQRDDGLVWYIHTKGVSKDICEWNNNPGIYVDFLGLESLDQLQKHEREWRLYMEHFVVKKHDDCIAALEVYDVAGVAWRDVPFLHFSGNFWWAKSGYVKSLKDPYDSCDEHNWNNDQRGGAETWIGSGSPLAKSFSNLQHNFYSWGVPMKDYLPIYL